MFHAVEDGKDHRLRPDGGRHISERGIEGESLDRKEHDVKGSPEIAGSDDVRCDRDVPMRAEDLQSVFLKRCRADRAHEEGHVTAGGGEAAAEISAGRPRSDNQ